MRQSSKRSLERPICVFSYHKSGTVLLAKVFREICREKGWIFRSRLGKQRKLPPHADVILFGHSDVDLDCIDTPFLGIHIIRDPRDIIVSGYLYHCRTTEKWCVNSDFTISHPIVFPQVPYSQEYRAEAWKINYLKSLGGRSYQENLRQRSQHDGLLFEMRHYGAWTINNMIAWDYQRSNILEVKFEQLMRRYDDTFYSIFSHLGFSETDISACLEITAKHDLNRKPVEEIQQMDHVSSTQHTRWREYFERQHKQEFIRLFGNVLIDLGYEKDNDW